MKYLIALLAVIASSCSTTSEFHKGCVKGIEEYQAQEESCDYECQEKFVEEKEEEVLGFCSMLEQKELDNVVKRVNTGSRTRR